MLESPILQTTPDCPSLRTPIHLTGAMYCLTELSLSPSMPRTSFDLPTWNVCREMEILFTSSSSSIHHYDKHQPHHNKPLPYGYVQRCI